MKQALLHAAIAVAAFFAVWFVFAAVAKPDLQLRIVPHQDAVPQLLLQFVNNTAAPVILDAGAITLVPYVPDDGSRRYFVHAQNSPAAPHPVAIAPGGRANAGDILPLIKGLPPGALKAVYSAAPTAQNTWHGVLHSPTLDLNPEGP